MKEAEMLEMIGQVIILYDSRKTKDEIAEILGISLNDVEDILDHRTVLGW